MLSRILLFIISAGVGTFVCQLLEKSPMNVWLARSIGGVVAVIVVLLLYKFWIKR